MAVQRAVLQRILTDNRATDFGRRHGFDRIAEYRDFVRCIAIQEYESLRPYIDAEIAGHEHSLTRSPPISYLRTSGTTDKPKDIPLTKVHLRALRELHQLSVAFQHRACPEAFAGGILAIFSPAIEGELANGKPYGAASGVVARATPSIVRKQFVVPAAVLSLKNSNLKYLLILRLALVRSDITYASTANATTFLTLMRLFRENSGRFIDDLRSGTFFLMDELPGAVKAAVRDRLIPAAKRARELELLVKNPEQLRMCHLWPSLKVVVTWTCASAGITVDLLRRELLPGTRIVELGYLASEFRGTITLGKSRKTGLPTFNTHFFEFVERSQWEGEDPRILTLDQLKRGNEYYVIVTTPSGLFRYFINDLVRVTGFLFKTPLLEFVQKGKGVTSITGEKLYEAQVIAAVRGAMEKAGRPAQFFMMLADQSELRYRLYVESGADPVDARWLAESVDSLLQQANVEYGAKRESARLAPLMAAWLQPGTGEAYKQHGLERGQREGQFKFVAIAYKNQFDFDLESRVLAA